LHLHPLLKEVEMPDDRRKRGLADPTRVNVEEPFEVRTVCRELNVTPGQLRAAVERVGPVIEDVRAELGKEVAKP
jgi:hypothetical protein